MPFIVGLGMSLVGWLWWWSLNDLQLCTLASLGVLASYHKTPSPEASPPQADQTWVCVTWQLSGHLAAQTVSLGFIHSQWLLLLVTVASSCAHLHKHDLHGGVIRRKPFLHPDHKVSFAKEHLKKPDVFSHSVPGTDKGKIELFGHNEQKYVGDKRVLTFMERTPSPFKHRDGLIMLWAWALGVTASDTGNISLLEEKIWSNMSKICY